jgi:hypothetical protein
MPKVMVFNFGNGVDSANAPQEAFENAQENKNELLFTRA